MADPAKVSPIIAAGVVLWHEEKVLLIRRRNEPLKDQWSIPGGRQRGDETIRACALRELQEETGLQGEILRLIDVVDANYETDTRHIRLTLIDFAARLIGGSLQAGDDAAEARWFPERELAGLGLWSETLRIIREGRVLVQKSAH